MFWQKESYKVKITIYSTPNDKSTKDLKCELVLLRAFKYISEISSRQSAEKELCKTVMNFVPRDAVYQRSKLQVKE